MRRLADCCCFLFFSPFILLAFFSPPSLLSSWSCSFLATRVPVDWTRCSRQHTSPLSASWNIHGQPGTAAQHSTAPHRPETTYLFISSPCCLAVWCTTTVQHTRASSHLPVSLRVTHHILFFLHSVSLIGAAPLVHKHAKLHICGYFDGSFPVLPFLLISISLSLALFLSLTFIRQMGGAWRDCWITDVCLWSLMVVLKYNAIIYNPA